MEKKWNNKRWNIRTDINIKKMIERLQDKNVDNPIVIPEFQRDYVWKEKQTPELLTSLYKGYPIGSIIVWDFSEEDEWLLIDGLQRNWTLYKIHEKPLNYIEFELYKHWAAQTHKHNFEFESDIDNKRFKHLKSHLHHARNEYRKATKEKAIKYIQESNSNECKWTENSKEKFIQFIEDYSRWFENEFWYINVPHYIVKDATADDISEIFEIINDRGTSLDRFEIISAAWSKYKINVGEEIDFVTEFNNNRMLKYKKEFEDSKKLGDGVIKFDVMNIQPSNFIYSIITEVFSNFAELRETFLKSDVIGTKTIYSPISKAVEPAAEIIINILRNKMGFRNVNFDNLGESLKKRITSQEDVKSLINDFKLAVKNTISNIRILSYAQNNKKDKGFDFPAWLISTAIIHFLDEKKTWGNIEKWFNYQLFIGKELDSGTGNAAKLMIKEKEFTKDFEKTKKTTLKKELQTLINSEAFEKSTYSSRNKILMLCMIQKENFTPSNKYHVDHLIPQTRLKKSNLDHNNIFILQMIPGLENIKKNDKLTKDQIKLDVFKNHYSDEEIKDININYEILSSGDKKNKLNIAAYKAIVKYRKKAMIEILKNADWI